MSGESKPSKWVIPPHTHAKHQILATYLDGWFPVLGSTFGRIVVLDGFAGRGVYADGSPDSPIIALSRLLQHSAFPRLRHREFVFVFVEQDAENAASLRREIDRFVDANQPWPANVKWRILEDTFEAVADSILSDLKVRQVAMAPLFAFIDPFGFQGLPMAKLAELASWPRAELCINFAANNVNRFLLEDSVQKHIEALFGCRREDVVDGFTGGSVRLPHLRDVYTRQLRAVANMDYVQSFEMRNDSGNASYYLYHATRSPKGVELMKDAMWKVDPGGGFTFSDRLAGYDVLFAPEPDLRPLHAHLTAQFGAAGPVAVENVKNEIALHTPYRPPHGSAVLRQMEKTGSLTAARPGRRRVGTFGPGTTLTFTAATARDA
jgi:three-Cys-motif partner protein